jgi:hypothetical protein
MTAREWRAIRALLWSHTKAVLVMVGIVLTLPLLPFMGRHGMMDFAYRLQGLAHDMLAEHDRWVDEFERAEREAQENDA